MRAAALVLAAFLAFPAGAGVRVQRVLDWRSGLPTSYTDEVEQDPDGFLMLSGDRGVARG